MNALRLALAFLTTLPVGRLPESSDRELGRSLLAYPLVGLLLGLILWVSAQLLDAAHPALQAALLLALWVGLTGALHLDGLADSADAWMGGLGDRERTLRILHDPTSGPIAIVALVLLLLLKWAALLALAGEGAALLIAPVLARSAALALMLGTPYARESGLGARLLQHAPRRRLRQLLMAVVLAALVLAPLALLLVAVLGWALRRACMTRIGGFTGDIAGALIETAELTVLLAFALGWQG